MKLNYVLSVFAIQTIAQKKDYYQIIVKTLPFSPDAYKNLHVTNVQKQIIEKHYTVEIMKVNKKTGKKIMCLKRNIKLNVVNKYVISALYTSHDPITISTIWN